MFRLFLAALDLGPAIGDWNRNDFSHGQDKVLSLGGIGGVLMLGFAKQGRLWRTVLNMDEYHYLANP